jgi:methylmalonyl-CoA/ethylmalonyl-CoA epimerase
LRSLFWEEKKKMKIEHIGIAVNNLEESLTLWAEGLNLRVRGIEEIQERGVKLASLEIDDGPSIELVAPYGEGSPLEKFLREKGEGIHHFCFEVQDVEDAVKKLKEKGIQFVHDKPQQGAEGSLIAFIHPRHFSGVLIELKEKKTQT